MWLVKNFEDHKNSEYILQFGVHVVLTDEILRENVV